MTVVAAALCPITPLLFRHLSGLADPVADLREACVQAVREAADGAQRVVVLAPVGGREAPATWRDPATGRGDGPLAAQVGAHLLDLAGCRLPATYAVLPGGPPVDDGDGEVALLVLGDGAAARGEGAPGYVDDRSFPYDDQVASLLGSGDGAGLASLDEELGASLMASGRMTWPELGPGHQPAEAELRWRGDPFGVSYFVALWRPSP